jgi:hypothetical protein
MNIEHYVASLARQFDALAIENDRERILSDAEPKQAAKLDFQRVCNDTD